MEEENWKNSLKFKFFDRYNRLRWFQASSFQKRCDLIFGWEPAWWGKKPVPSKICGGGNDIHYELRTFIPNILAMWWWCYQNAHTRLCLRCECWGKWYFNWIYGPTGARKSARTTTMNLKEHALLIAVLAMLGTWIMRLWRMGYDKIYEIDESHWLHRVYL